MVESTKLKFGYEPTRTAKISYYEDRLAATVRYEDEKGIDEGTRLKMIHADSNDFIGYANVIKIKTVSVWEVIGIIDREDAIYGMNYTHELINKLSKYYFIGVGPMTEVKVIFYRTIQLTIS